MSEGNQVNNLNLEADKQIVIIHNHGNLTVNAKDKTSPVKKCISLFSLQFQIFSLNYRNNKMKQKQNFKL